MPVCTAEGAAEFATPCLFSHSLASNVSNSLAFGGSAAFPLAGAEFAAASCAAKAPDIDAAASMIAVRQIAAIRPATPRFSRAWVDICVTLFSDAAGRRFGSGHPLDAGAGRPHQQKTDRLSNSCRVVKIEGFLEGWFNGQFRKDEVERIRLWISALTTSLAVDVLLLGSIAKAICGSCSWPTGTGGAA